MRIISQHVDHGVMSVLFQRDEEEYIEVIVHKNKAHIYTDPVSKWDALRERVSCCHGKLVDTLSFKDNEDAVRYFWEWVEDPDALYMGSIV